MIFRKNILHVNKAYYPITGGVEYVVQNLAERINTNEFKSRVLVCRGDRGPTYVRRCNGKLIIYAGSFGTFASLPISFSFFYLLFKLKNWAHIIHWHEPFPLATIAGLLLRKSSNFKTVVTWHSDIVRQKFVKPIITYLQRKVLKQVTTVVFTSDRLMASSDVANIGIPFRVIPLGIEVPHSNHPEEYSEGNYCLYIGRLVYYKGVDVLIDSARSIDGNLKIVGDGPLRGYLEQKICQYNLGDKVELVGKVDDEDKEELIKACSFLVMPSTVKTEAFGIVQLEAMMFGKPVINTNLPTGVPWVSLNGITGLTVDVRNAEQLTAAINTLFNQPEICNEMGRNARKRVDEIFTMESMIKNYEGLYHEIT